jgi:integrase
MASLLKVWVIRYLDGGGRQVPKGSAGARKVKERSAKWYGQYTDQDGRRRRVPLCTDKAAARQMLAKIEREVQLGNIGITNPFAKHRAAPIKDHVADYERHLRNKNVSEEYREQTLSRLTYVLEYGKVRVLGDINPEDVARFLVTVEQRGTGTRMQNSYLDSAKAFLRWCVLNRRIGENVLDCLMRAKGEVRRRRRALTEDELIRLLKTARERPLLEVRTIRSGRRKGERVDDVRKPETHAKFDRLGWERCLIYKTLVYTGLRRGELEALQVRNLTLDGTRPCVVLPPEVTKNRKGTDIPLRADLVEDLKAWLKATGKTGSDRVFRVAYDLNNILKHDMKWAGIAYKDDQGRTIDVHALRHTTATYLSRAKVSPRIAQGFMRHADIKLTMQTYSDPRLLDEAEALNALPEMKVEGETPEQK